MKLSEEEILNKWLSYHNTTVKGVLKNHPEWSENPSLHSREFYDTYPVTQEQHDEWYEWFISEIMLRYRYSRKRARRESAFIYLNLAPKVI